jgi:hypothetical protein
MYLLKISFGILATAKRNVRKIGGETIKKSIPIAYKGKGVGILVTKKFGKILV